MFRRKQAYSFIEVMVVMMILGLTATIALTIYNPRDQANEDTAYTQLEQLKNAIIIHNAQHSDFVFQDENTDPSSGPLWWTLLPGISDPDLTDPWGAYYEHDYFKGAVYSTGPDMINDNGEGDDILIFYRPPSAEIVAREPEPNSTVNSATPTIATTWRFGGGLTIEGAVFYVDKKPIAAKPDVAEYGVLPDPTFFGAAFGSGAGSNYSTAAISFVAPHLSDGIHYAQVKIIDSQGNARRASWSFRIDTSPPKIYALNPIPDSTFEYKNPLVSCLYHDASGINTKSARFDLEKDGTSIFGSVQTYADMNNPANNFQLSASGLSWRPDIAGLGDGVYTVKFSILDGAGNPDPVTDTIWKFTIKDETAPSIQIHQPVDESAMTTSVDIDMDPANGVQIAVVGTTERSMPGSMIKVDLEVDQVWDGGSEGVDQIDDLGATVTTLTTYSDAAGSFRFPRVTIKDVNTAMNDEPKNVIRVKATDAAPTPNFSEADTTVYLFNNNNRLKCTVTASPMTTQPNENILFSVWADKGTTPYSYVWDFDDGFTREGSLMTANTTSSLKHTFATTGNFIVTCQVTDQRGLTSTASQNIYVGTEATTPSLYLDAVPPEVFCGAPDGSTKFHIRIGGKYLGFWRLHVESNPDSVAGYRWYYSSSADKMYYTTDVHDEPDPNGEILWQSASSNDFVVEWDGTDNFKNSPHSFFNNAERRFPSNKMTGAVNRTHFAYLEYIDALGELVKTSCTVAVYSSIPSPKGIKITAVKQITNSPELYDINIDGTPDYTCSPVVDLVAFTPESTNPTHMWISNYPLELHNIVNPGQSEITTYQIQVPPDGEIFWNWTMTDGLDYSAVDGSSGWVPIDPTTEAANPVFDWPITAWPESDLTQMFSGAMLTSFSRPWRYPTTVWEMQPRNGGNIWNSLGQPGMNMEHEGKKRIYAIFQDAHIFTSTQVESTEASAGVTSCEIFYDISGPTPSSTPAFSNVEVIDNGTGSYSVTATITVTAADLSDTGFGYEWGSGLLPDGLVVVQPEGQYARYYSYSSEVDVDFGPLDEVVKNSTLSASVTYEDNLGRPTTIAASDPLKQAQASISRFTWTLTGGGGYTFYRKSDRSHFLLINTQETSHGKVPPKVNLEGKATIFDIDANDPKLEHWMNNGATLSSSTGSQTFEDQWISDISNIDPTHFPNENDRLGHLRARRPWYPWAVEQEATFVVDNLHHYYAIMMKGDVYVEYRVYKGPDANAACRPSNVGAQIIPAEYVVTNPAFTEVARVDKVSRQKFNPARVNEAEMWLPGEDSEPANNDVYAYRDLHSSSTDAGPFPALAPYNKLKCWDELTDLLIEESTSSSHYETYTYRGILMGRDGGTIDKCRYKVTSNSFSAKMGFVPVTAPEAAISTNRYDVTTKQDYHRMLIKAELIEQAAGGNGWGIQVKNTFIEDVALPGYGSLGIGEISGSKFCIRFSDYSNDFDGMTTGTVRPCILLEFDGTGDRARVTTSGALVSWDGTLPATSDWFICYGTHSEVVDEGKGGMHDLRGEPIMRSADIDWSTVLDGEEGTVTAYVSYIDGQGNQLTHYTTTASIDSAPPTFLGTAAVTMWSNPGHGLHYSEGGSTFRRSVAPKRWTSNADFTCDYSAVNDSGSLFREYVGTTPSSIAACSAVGTFVAHPTTAAATYEGDASPTNGDVANWLPITSSFYELMNWDMGNAIQGQNTCYFRFKDDSHNVAPAILAAPDDGMGVEPEVSASLAVDTYAPDRTYPGNVAAAPTITVVTNTAGTVGRNDLGFGVPIISDEFPIFQWTSSENVPGNETANSGIAGVNFGVDTAGNTTTPPQVYPPMVNLLPEYYTSYDFSVSNTIHSSCVALGQNGRKRFAAQAVDLVGHIGPKSEVEFIYDKSGPILTPSNINLSYNAYVAGNITESYDDVTDSGWTGQTLDWTNLQIVGYNVEEIVFTCTRGEIALQGVQLRSSTTAPAVRWPTDGSLWNPDHGTDVHQWPSGGGIYGYGEDFGDHDDWYPDYDGYMNLFRWAEGANSLWRVDRVFFIGGDDWDKRDYRLDDVQLHDGGNHVQTILPEGSYTSWLDDSTSWEWTAVGPEPVANRIRVDWDARDSGKYTYSRWEAEGRRVTLRAGESFSMSGLTTQANRLVWQHINRNRSVRKEYTAADCPKNITDWNWTGSTINVPDNINVHVIKLYVDITHTYRGDLRIWLEDPDNNDGGAVWYDRGGSEDNLVGWFNDELETNDWNALRWHNNPPNSNYNANGNWDLWIYDHGSNDEGTLNGWKLVIFGDLSGFNESSDYSVKIVGSGGWTGWQVAGSVPENVISNAIRFDLDWAEINTCAQDQPNPGEAAGVTPNDTMVTHEWEYAVVATGADPVWITTSLSRCIIEPPPGEMRFFLRGRDRVANAGPEVHVFGCLADVEPPAGNMDAYGNVAMSTANPIAADTAFDTNVISYVVHADEDTSDIVAACYHFATEGNAVDPEDGVPPSVTVPIGPYPPADPDCWIQFGEAGGIAPNPVAEGSREIKLRIQDAGGSWSNIMTHHCYIDRTAPGITTLNAYANNQPLTTTPIPEGNVVDTNVISYRLQTNEDQSKIVAYDIEEGPWGTVSDPDGTGATSITPMDAPDPIVWIQDNSIAEGRREIRVIVQDLCGKWSNVMTHTCWVDRTAPSGTLTAYVGPSPDTSTQINDGDGINTTTIAYRIQTNEDQTPIVAYCYTLGGYGTIVDPVDGAGATVTVPIAPAGPSDPVIWIDFAGIWEGHREFRVKVKDNSGKWSNAMSHHCYVDRTAPNFADCDSIDDNWAGTAGVQINGTGVNFNGTARDNAAGSGIASVLYRFNPSDTTAIAASLVASTYSHFWDPDSSGSSPFTVDNATGGISNQLQVRLTDNAGNQSGWMDVQAVYIDNQAPGAPSGATEGDPNFNAVDYFNGSKNENNSDLLVDYDDDASVDQTLVIAGTALNSGNSQFGGVSSNKGPHEVRHQLW